MSKQNKTQSSATFDPTSKAAYDSNLGIWGPALTSAITSPFSNPTTNLALGKWNAGVGTSSNAATQALMQRASALGISPNSPQYFSQLNAMQRNNAAIGAQGTNNIFLQALQTRNNDISALQRWTPLQTGGTMTSRTTGMGTWLPQVAQAGLQGVKSIYDYFGHSNNVPGSVPGEYSDVGPGQDMGSAYFGSAYSNNYSTPFMNNAPEFSQSANPNMFFNQPQIAYGTTSDGFTRYGNNPFAFNWGGR